MYKVINGLRRHSDTRQESASFVFRISRAVLPHPLYLPRRIRPSLSSHSILHCALTLSSTFVHMQAPGPPGRAERPDQASQLPRLSAASRLASMSSGSSIGGAGGAAGGATGGAAGGKGFGGSTCGKATGIAGGYIFTYSIGGPGSITGGPGTVMGGPGTVMGGPGSGEMGTSASRLRTGSAGLMMVGCTIGGEAAMGCMPPPWIPYTGGPGTAMGGGVAAEMGPSVGGMRSMVNGTVTPSSMSATSDFAGTSGETGLPLMASTRSPGRIRPTTSMIPLAVADSGLIPVTTLSPSSSKPKPTPKAAFVSIAVYGVGTPGIATTGAIGMAAGM